MNQVDTTHTPATSDDSQAVVGVFGGNRFGNFSRRSQIAVGVVFVIIVAVVGMSLHSSNPKKFAAEDDQENFKYEATVQLTNSGFTPSYATVRADTRVYFENPGTPAPTVTTAESRAEGLQPGSSSDAEDADNYAGPIRQFAAAPASPKSDSNFKAPGKIAAFGTVTHIFRVPGTYIFYDINQPTHNLTIIVQ